MPFRVKVNDVPVEVDTPEELLSLLAKMGAFAEKSKASGVPEEFPSRITIPSDSEKMANFYNQIRRTKSFMFNIIDALYNGESFSSQALKNALKIESDHVIGGAMAGITKIAERHMLERKNVLKKYRDRKTGELYYQLTPAMREVIQAQKESHTG
jgi:hypothetical protein